MSANLDLVRSIYEAWERGDFSRADWADPEIEYVIADGPSPGRWKGLAGLGENARDQMNAWLGFRFEVDEYRQLDDERVLVLMHFSARGKKSGLEMGQVRTDGATLFHVRGGRVTRYVFYWQRDRALADLGPEEEVVAEESTTPDLEALTQRLLDATNARDFDAVISLYAPEAVWDTTETFGVFQGRQAIRGFLEEWIGTYEEVEFEVEERRNLGHDVIFAVVKTRGRLPGSTGWIHLRYASVVTWVGGLIERSAAYRDIDEGRAAAERLAEERG